MKIISTSSSVKYDLINHYNFREEKIITLRFQPIRFEDLVEYSKPDHEDYFQLQINSGNIKIIFLQLNLL